MAPSFLIPTVAYALEYWQGASSSPCGTVFNPYNHVWSGHAEAPTLQE